MSKKPPEDSPDIYDWQENKSSWKRRLYWTGAILIIAVVVGLAVMNKMNGL